ncbi:MAG: glycosyl hydrolase [Acidobacteriia bacterium]|nr:glycosyl hydrolase [Terriglobia bacterium]
MIFRRLVVVLVFLAGFNGTPSAAQGYDPNLFNEMKWRLLGPFRGGRALAVTGVPGDPSVYYFGAVAGGVWKSADGGATWKPISDHEPISSIGAIAVAESDHNVIYAGTGEACIRGNISYGDGVYKSTDGGKTWSNIGLRDTRHIGAIVVDPRNADIVFVAALGHVYGPNAERGIFRTTDGGKTWQKVLSKDERTGGIDVVFDPGNPRVVYAALWQAYRTPWSLSSGGPGSGLYKSTDGGTTWKRLEGHGLPEGVLGRIGISVSGADSNRVYALIEAKAGGLYRSDDAGDTWTRVNDDERYRQRAWYFTHVFADPASVDTVYLLNTGLFRSTDGGKSFTLLPAPHGDHHGLWIDPANSKRLINGNDGGVSISVDGGQTWTQQGNQPTAQFYHVITDNQWPYYVYGTQQDNSSVGIPSFDDSGVIGRWSWFDFGGETGFVAPDPSDPNIIYSNNEGTVGRFDKRSQQTQDVSLWPLDVSGHGAKDLEYRYNWTSPLMISPHDANTIYSANNRLFRSRNKGMSWEAISPDLTRNDKSKQEPSGGPITLDITSVEYFDTIFAVAESARQKDLLWVGTDDGLVQVSRDGGANWSNVTPKALPEWSLVSVIEASPLDAGTAYIAVDRHKLDDFRPYIFKTNDYGKTWTSISNGIPDGSFVHAVREDSKRKGLLYAGTERGVFVSWDDGAHWQPLQLNLPTTPVTDLVVHDDDLVIATNGRSFWVLDDLMPLRELDAQVAHADVHLFRTESAVRLHLPEDVNRRRPVGQNPPPGAIIDYYLKTKPAGDVTLDILDAQGGLVRHYSSKEKKIAEQPPEWPDQEKPKEVIPAEAGLNRFAWDLRHEPPIKIPGAFYSGIGPQGPLALPGAYQVKLTIGGQTQTQPLELRMDPRVKNVSLDDLQKEFELGKKIRDANSRLHIAVNQIRQLRGELETLRKWAGTSQGAAPVIAAAEQLDKKMTPIEEQLIQVKMKSSEGNLRYPNMLNEQLDSLSHTADAADAAPTGQLYKVFDDLKRKLEAELAQWADIVQKDLPALNQLMRSQGVPALEAPSGNPAD